MVPESWAGLAALLLTLVAVTHGLRLFKRSGWWVLVTVSGRVAAVLALSVALSLLVIAHGGWSPFVLQHATLGLAWSTLVVYLALAWWLRTDAAASAVDLVALALVLTAIVAGDLASAPLTCAERAVPFQVQWLFFLLGGGGLMVAGSASLMLGIRIALARGGLQSIRPRSADLHVELKQATLLALVALGSGLVVGVWWTWRATGFMNGSGPGLQWAAITWLLAAMGVLARRAGEPWRRWTAGLAGVAAAMAAFGMLLISGVGSLLGA